MVELKTLKPEALPSALDMAKTYRLLNEPQAAESICMDILAVDPKHQDAHTTMLLALTDMFSSVGLNPAYEKAMAIVENLDDQYCKAYYSGIVYERRAKYHMHQGSPGSGEVAYEWFAKALHAFGKALDSCDPDNQDAVLRWNSCARIINSDPNVKPGDNSRDEMLLDAFEEPH
jgi:hypothetical protein